MNSTVRPNFKEKFAENQTSKIATISQKALTKLIALKIFMRTISFVK